MPLRTWRRLVLVISGALFAAIVYRWISLERLQRAAPAEILATPTPEPTPTRPPVISGKLDTAKLFNGITLHSTVETIPGSDATTERMQPDSYVLELKLQARVPSPNKTIEELLANTEDAYGFPPYSQLAPYIVVRGETHAELRVRERDVLKAAMQGIEVTRIRVPDYTWAQRMQAVTSARQQEVTDQGVTEKTA